MRLFSCRALTQDRETQPAAHLSQRSEGAAWFKFQTKKKKISAFCKTDKCSIQSYSGVGKRKMLLLQETKLLMFKKT